MTDRELMQQALEALETCKVYGEDHDEWASFSGEKVGAAVIALRERLAQQERAWITAGAHTAPLRTHWEGCEEVHPECKRPATREEKIVRPGVYEVPVEQEPVATVESKTGNPDILMSWWHEPALPVGTKLYTTPPRREWVGLTEEEKLHLEIMGGKSDVMLAEAIEAKLKEKNA